MERTDFVKRDTETRESLIRLESELKSQRELLGENMRLMEKRFDQVDKRFEEILRTFIYSSFSFTAAAAGVVIAVLKFT